jgi:glutaredoxin 3
LAQPVYIRKSQNWISPGFPALGKFVVTITSELNDSTMKKSIFYHAGCPVCISAEQDIIHLIGESQVEIIHLGESANRISEAEQAGVQSVPALVTPNGNVLHINFGASLADLKG